MIDSVNGSAVASLIDLDSTFLPIAHMRQIARITCVSGGSITGEVDIGAEHWAYPQHFPGDPIFPGTLMIEAAGQLVALWAWSQGQRGRPRLIRASAEFRRPAGPRAGRLVLHGEVRRKRHLHFGSVRISAGDDELAAVEAVLAVLPPA